MNILKNIVRVGLIVTALSFNLVSCDYLDVVPPEQAGLQVPCCSERRSAS